MTHDEIADLLERLKGRTRHTHKCPRNWTGECYCDVEKLPQEIEAALAALRTPPERPTTQAVNHCTERWHYWNAGNRGLCSCGKYGFAANAPLPVAVPTPPSEDA